MGMGVSVCSEHVAAVALMRTVFVWPLMAEIFCLANPGKETLCNLYTPEGE